MKENQILERNSCGFDLYFQRSFLCVLLPDWQCKWHHDLIPQQNCWKLFKMNHLKYLEILRAQEKWRNTHSRKSRREKQYYVVLEPNLPPLFFPSQLGEIETLLQVGTTKSTGVLLNSYHSESICLGGTGHQPLLILPKPPDAVAKFQVSATNRWREPLLHPTAIPDRHLCCCCMLKTLGPRLPCNQLLYPGGILHQEGKTRLEATVHSFNECSVTKLGVSHREKNTPLPLLLSIRLSKKFWQGGKAGLKTGDFGSLPPNPLHLEWSLKSKPKHNHQNQEACGERQMRVVRHRLNEV